MYTRYLVTMASGIGDGVSKSRLEILTDGIFAIVMTILVLEFVVPHVPHSDITTAFPKYLLELWPVFLSYVTSFIMLGFFWIAHDKQFHYIKRANETFLWISIFYLMFIALIPFSTMLIGEYGDQQISILIYGVNLIISISLNYVQWRYATTNHRLVDSDLDPMFIIQMTRRIFIGICMFMGATIVSFGNINVSLLLYMVTPILLIALRKIYIGKI